MKRTHSILTLAATAVFAAAIAAPIPASAASASRQKHKNNWRNGAIAGGVVAGYGLLKHNTTATVLGAAGAAYSANRYEQERKHQDERKRARARYHSHGGDYYRNGRKYYKYDGHMYYKDLRTGERHRAG